MATYTRRFPLEEAIRLYKIGLDHRKIGYFLGVTNAGISHGLKRMGYRSSIAETPLSPVME
jgi:hypothetical protein